MSLASQYTQRRNCKSLRTSQPLVRPSDPPTAHRPLLALCASRAYCCQVNYILIAVALALLMFVCRGDRRLVALLLCWSCTLFILLLVNQFALWYIALGVDFAVYALLYGSEADKKEEEDEEEEEGEEEEGAGEGQQEEFDEGEGLGDEEEEGAKGWFNEANADVATKSQPVTFRSSTKRASVILKQLQL